MNMRNKMKNQLVAGVLALGALGAPAYAEGALTLQSIFPAGTKLTITGEQTIKDGLYARIARIETPIYSLQMSGVELTGTAQRKFVNFTSLTAIPKIAGGQGLMINDGKMTLSGQPEGADLCSWTRVIDGFEGGAVIITEPEVAEKDKRKEDVQKARFDLAKMSFTRARNPICGLSGVLRAARVSLTETGGTNYLMTDMELQAIIPFTPSQEENQQNTAIRIKSNEVQYSHEKEIPSVGGLEFYGKLDLDSASTAGLAQVLMSYDFLSAPPKKEYIAAQIYNAFTLLKGNATFELPVMRIYAAGVVPSEAVANFSRVGLSTITGDSSIGIKLNSGEVEVSTELSMVGIADIELKSHGFISPYRSEIFKALAAGIELGWHKIPDARMIETKISVNDTGFDRAVEDLTGVPSARYAEEMISRILIGYDGPYLSIAQSSVQALTKFLRDIPDGQTYEIRFTPEKLINVTEMILMGVKDFNGLLNFGRFGYTARG